MVWQNEGPLARRPIVLIEDHLYHISETLDLLVRRAPRLLGLLTAVCLDRPGPDTERSVRRWLETYPDLRLAAAVSAGASQRLTALPPEVFEHASDLARAIGPMLRPGGLLLQDVQLETLRFIPRGRWWESIYLASTVRGMFPSLPPTCRFLSNKRGYQATFGRDLLDAGFDPRDVLDKNQLDRVLVAVIGDFLADSMPWTLRLPTGGGETLKETVVATDSASRAELEQGLDLVLWRLGEGVEIGGRGVKTARKPRLVLKPGSPEGRTWLELVEDHFSGGEGVPVLEVGRRLAPELAGRAEMTNCAARHAHLLRSRLVDGGHLETARHAYRLQRSLRIGLVLSPAPAWIS